MFFHSFFVSCFLICFNPFFLGDFIRQLIFAVFVLFILLAGCITQGSNNSLSENKKTELTNEKEYPDSVDKQPETFEEKKATDMLTFSEEEGPACYDTEKPVIRLFSTTWCPHCVWIKETFDSVVKEYVDKGKITAYHWELDTKDNTLTDEIESVVPESELEIYRNFSPRGSIPTFVFGCKYYRVGNGFESSKDLVSEENEFKTVIETLLQGA